jgi:hypothetical protein
MLQHAMYADTLLFAVVLAISALTVETVWDAVNKF